MRIVTKDIKLYMIYAGNPAKKSEKDLIKTIDDLLKIKWWELDEKI